MKTKILTIYLPQFHTIPENDEWWGSGFTEWDNVRRGVSYYPGHYQPREPLLDDYYDLSDLKVLEKHTRMARKAGISGFCFYHYYFKGRKLLERPIEAYRDKSKEKFPYCLIWANQSWARTWYKADRGNTILLQQAYGSRQDWENHFLYLLPFFKDERYIKIDNKPLYIIYLPQDIACRKEMFEIWKQMAKESGFDGIYLVAMKTWYGTDCKSTLYDAYMNFEPMHILKEDNSYRKKIQQLKEDYKKRIRIGKNTIVNWMFMKNTYSYQFMCKRIEKAENTDSIKNFLGVFSGWDNTPRKDESGQIITGSSPSKFGRNVFNMLKLSEKLQNQYLFLNAWNEWSEGAYIEPDKRYGYAYLNALKKAVKQYKKEK